MTENKKNVDWNKCNENGSLKWIRAQNTVTAGRFEEEENKTKMMMEVNLKVVKMKIIASRSLIPNIHN